ncbi:unnamed protein product [Caenorhabditis bovis]|uniref:Uncharacterized protein n=1 Tax=Caenorhabditis bovis TaxID=2654633 RepID=A0A8S1EA45_9PELO|nr:unnamed protein product [Caenorhabditis bovis]
MFKVGNPVCVSSVYKPQQASSHLIMISLRSIIILLGLITIAYACAPSVHKSHGYCEYYVDGTSDIEERSKRSTDSDNSGGGGGGGKFRRTKKKTVKCYRYEDGTSDSGATLEEGVEEPKGGSGGSGGSSSSSS